MPEDLRGVLVTNVDPASPSAALGLRADDVIVEVNRTETPTVDAFREAARTSEDNVLLLVYRDGSTVFMSLSRR